MTVAKQDMIDITRDPLETFAHDFITSPEVVAVDLQGKPFDDTCYTAKELVYMQRGFGADGSGFNEVSMKEAQAMARVLVKARVPHRKKFAVRATKGSSYYLNAATVFCCDGQWPADLAEYMRGRVINKSLY